MTLHAIDLRRLDHDSPPRNMPLNDIIPGCLDHMRSRPRPIRVLLLASSWEETKTSEVMKFNENRSAIS